MRPILKIGSLLLFFTLLTSCNFGDSGYHKEDGKWTWKYYHGGDLEFKFVEIDSINHDEFIVISEKYGKDDRYIFFEGSLIPKADPVTFKKIKDDYSGDENHIFFGRDIVLFANPKTFQLLEWPYSKDDSHVFCGTVPLNLKKNEVNQFRVTNSSQFIDFTSLPSFIERNPEYKWLDTLGVDGIITGDDGTGKTNNKKFKGVKELTE